MAKRRSEDTLLPDSPSKRCCRALCSTDMQLEGTPPTGGVSLSPPSLLALLGSRCRKRPHYFEDPQREREAAAALNRKTAHCDTRRKHAANVLTVQTSGSFQDRGISSSATNIKKRPRQDSEGSETTAPKASDKAPKGDTNNEDCTYNSFQYWRVPLPELDLSLLEDVSDGSHIKQNSKVKKSSSDAMET